MPAPLPSFSDTLPWSAATILSLIYPGRRATRFLIEASLSFLGLWDPTAKRWGSVLYNAEVRSASFSGAWVWWAVPPGLFITFTVLGSVFSGYTL